MNDKREQLYNNLLGSGMVDESNIGTIDEFKGAIKDEQSARQFYNNLVGFGFNDSQIGSEDDFYNSISSDFQPQQETYPQEVEDAYNDPKNAAPYFKDKSQLNKEFQNGNMTVGNDKPSFWERLFSAENLNAAGKAFNSHVASNAQTPYQEPTPKPAEEEVHYNTPKPQQVVVGRGEEPSLEQIQQAADSSKQVQQTIQQQQQWKAEDEAMDFVPKKVETEKDILDNAQGRFALTEEGKALKAEADEAMQGYVDQLSEEFKESPEYKELTKVQPKNQQELDELNKKLNEAFQQKYETQLDEFAQPYEKKMGDALFNRYGDDIDNQLKKLGAKNAEEDLSRISGEVDDMYKKKVGTWDDEKKRLAAKFGQHRVNLTEQDKEAYENAVANDADLRNLTASKHLIEESNEIVNAVKNGDEAALKQMFRGLWDNLDARNFTFGLSEMADNATILQALQKAEKGEKLTDAEEKLLEAQVANMAVKGYYAEQLSLGYKVGQTTGASLPFMLEFIANPIARSGNAIAKGLLKYGMKQAGKRLGLGAAKALNTAPVKFAGRLVGDALAASGMLATTSMPGVTADTMERLSNNYEVKMEDGEPVVKKVDNEIEPFEAWSKALQTRFIENQSEMVFNAFKGFNPFGQVKLPNNVASFINMVRESAPGRLYRDILGNKTLREFAQAAQFHGLPEEYLEEVYNNFANVLTGEMDAKDALSLDRNIETFLGLVPTTLMFGALGVGSYARERRAFREKYGKMTDEQKEKYEYLREMAKNGKKSLNREVKRFLNETFNADNLTPEERRSEIEFLFDSVKGITMEEIDAERTPEQKVQDGVEEAEMDGAEAVEPADMNRIGVDLEVATQEMDNIFGATTRTMFDADPMAAAADVMNNPNYTAEEKQVALDYLNAKTAYNSMIGRIREDIGREVEESNAEIDNRTDAETGAVRPATLKNGGRQVYIMNGNVVMYEDGSGVDLGNSSKDVIVKYAETGKLEFIPASDISSIEQPIPAEQLKEETAANIQQTKAQEEADKINGTLAFQQGDTYQAMGEDGTQVELTIISDNGDGSVNVGINGEAAAVPMAKETVQQMADRFKQQQAQKASIERRAAQMAEQQEAAPAGRAYRLNEEVQVTLPDGTPGTAFIQAEPNADEQYEVELSDASGNVRGVSLMTQQELNAMEVTQPEAKTKVSDDEFDDIMRQLDDIFNGSGSMIDFFDDNWGKGELVDIGVEMDGNTTLEHVRKLFDRFNTGEHSAELKTLADKVFALVKHLNLEEISFNSDKDFNFGQQGLYSRGFVRYRHNYFTHPDIAPEQKAHVLLHELVHAATLYAIVDYEKGGKHLSENMIDAVKTLVDVFEQIKDDKNFKGEYGVSSVREMVAEISSPQFRTKLKAKNLWKRIINAIKQLLDVKPKGNASETTAYDEVSNALNYMIDNFDGEAYYLYSGRRADGSLVHSQSHEDDFFASIIVLNPEQKAKVQTLGTRAAIAMFERGKTSFDEFALAMTDRLGNNIQPFLKSFYNNAKNYIQAKRSQSADNDASNGEFPSQELPVEEASSEVASQPEEDADAMPMIGENENAEPNYGAATPQRTSRYIYDENGLEEQDADQLVQMKRKAAEKVLSDTKKAKPEFGDKGIGDNIVKLKQARAAWEQSVADAQRQVDYWNAVEQEHAMAVRQREEAAKAEPVSKETSESEEIRPIGVGVFGNIYDQFKGKVKQALDFLLKNRSGDLLGVFHRDGFGDIDLVWGNKDEERGLDHIIEKHVNRLKDFASAEEAVEAIEDIINNGTIIKNKWDKATFEKDGYRVIVSKNVRNNNGQIVDNEKRWVVTAFDNNKTEKEKATSATTIVTPDSTSGSRAVTPDEAISENKDITSSDNIQTNQQENESLRQIPDEKQPLRDRAKDWEKKVGVKVTLVESVDELPQNSYAAQAIREGKNVQGWYNIKQDKIYIYVPNVKSESEIDKTYMHEVVAHKGLRQLLGADAFNKLCDDVFASMSEKDRKFFMDYPGVKVLKGKERERAAADEYIAFLSEYTDLNPTLWEKIVAAIREAMRQLGITVDVTREDIAYILDKSYNNLVEANADLLRDKGADVDTERGDVRFAVKDILKGKELDKTVKELMAVTGRSESTVKKWIKAEESLAKVILDDDNVKFLDMQVDESVPSIWNNSDYPQGTVEFSNICRKRLPFTMIYQRLQKEFPNMVFSASTLEDIRNTMKQNGVDVACGLCFVEDRRQLLGEIGQGFIDALEGKTTDLNENQTKALSQIDDKYIPNLYDLLTLDGMKKLRKEHPSIAKAFIEYNNARGMQAGRLFQAYSAYHREILTYPKSKVKKINNNGGLRIFSFSDFEAHHLIDLVQVLTDAASKGIKVQGYTKVPEFAKAVKDTKMKTNRSLIAKDKGYVDADYQPKEGEAVSPNVIDGKRLLLDTVEGINVNHPDFFDSTSNPNVGNILVGINDEQIKLAMRDPFVDYIIPFHSGLSENIRQKKGIGEWVNYKLKQLEKKQNEDGKLTNADKHGINIYTDVLPRGNELIGHEIKNAKDFQKAFLAACAEKGWIPRFWEFIDKDKKGNYKYTPGYEKMLIDFKLFDKNGKIVPQEAVVPVFDNDFNKQILDDYVKGEKEKMPDDELYEKIKESLGLAEGEETRFRITPEEDAEYMDAVNSGDMEKAAEMVKAAAKKAMPDTKVVDENGNPLVVYHGTPSESITVFDKGRIGTRRKPLYGRGFYFTDKKLSAEFYGENLYPVFLNIKNPFYADEYEKLYADIITLEDFGFPTGYTLEDLKNELENIKEKDVVQKVSVDSSRGNDRYYVYAEARDDRWNSVNGRDIQENEVNDYLSGKKIDEDAKNAVAYRIIAKKYPKVYDVSLRDLSGETMSRILKDNEFDGVIGAGTNFWDVGANEYISLAPNQIKSAEPVTYDDEGKAIPLSERFNPENSDIRFRVSEDKTLMGVHNISETKLKKAIKNGGLANPSLAVIDTRNGMHNDFGEISLIPKSSLIDKRTGRNAGTYAGDAWTPSYPTVEKRMTDKGESQAWKDMREAMNGNDEDGIRSETKRVFNEYLEDDRSPDRLAYWFFKEKGVQPEIIRYDSGVSEEDKQLFNEHVGDARSFTELDEQGRDVVLRLMANAEGKTVEDMLATYQRIKENMQRKLVEDPNPMFKVTRERTIEQIENYGIITSNADNVMGRVRAAMYQDGKVNVQETLLNAVNQMREGNQQEFDNWLDGKEQKYGVEEYIFNGYTPSGKRRYVQNTVENVSKLMNKESERNAGNDTGFGAFRSIIMEKYGSLAEIRRNKDKLKKGDDIKEEVDKMSDELFGIIKQLADMKQLSSNPFTNVSYADARLQEAVATSNPVGYLNREYGYNIPKDGEFAKELSDIIAKVVTTPVKYFETKFKRPVRLNEFAIAVVPENTSEDVVNALKNAGLDVRTYDGTDEGRTNATMEAVNDRDDIRFRVSEEEAEMRDALADKLNEVGIETSVAPVYYSNAEKAVQDIKQEKATPEQWLKMIEKNGGLKAGEDKWTGLSDYLKNSKAKSLTKQEVLDYIRQNEIQIKEVNYAKENDLEYASEEEEKEYEDLYESFINQGDYEFNAKDKAIDALREKYGKEYGHNGASLYVVNSKEIQPVRLEYTTAGLDNKREIALTVPTIEPWNESDDIHFGDAGEGRAVAWVRFGDTTNIEKDPELLDAGRKLNDFESDMQEKYDTAGNDLLERLTPEERTRYDELVADVESHRREKRVLVIDEIQSKRHQEGREKGYESELASSPKGRWVEAVKSSDSFSEEMKQKYGDNYLLDQLTEEERKRHEELVKELNEASNYQDEKLYNIPDAPFEKNWHELAMKRMLRYAAENGYDKVAWTKGNQQAERYDIGKKIKRVVVDTINDGSKLVTLDFRHDDGYMDFYQMQVNDEGKIIGGDFVGNSLSDIVGKDLAVKLLASKDRQIFENENVRIGGEGMKGFYDDMLPRFMNKYGKKWGVKVGEVDLPNLEEAGQKMWSVDVTPEMKESVMQGQPMFHRTTDGRAYGYTQDGKIYIDPRIATSETPIHEYAHLWAEALRRGNAEEWSNVVNLMKGTSIWNDVANNYPELNTDDLLAEEVLAHYSGSRGAARLRKAQEDAMNNANGVFEKAEVASAFDSVRRALNRFWKAVADFLNIHYTSAEEVSDRVLNDLLSGVNPNEVASIDGDAEVRFRVIDDQQMIDRLESEPQETGYRNVVLNEDGTLGSPMAGKLGGKNGRKATSSFEMNRWEMAEENPDIANENGKVDLIKPNGKPVSGVDYNPYIHIRPTMVNTQFKEAWKRPELVYVKTAYPASELNGEYKAEKAKLSVGRHPWNGGELILSRYDKPVEIMSWEEVADDWMNEFDGKGIHFDIIPPKLLPILVERGAKIIPPHKNLGKECEDAYKAFKAQQEQSGDIRFSISDDVSSEINGKEYNAGVKTFDEAITEGLAELVRKNKDAVQTRADVLHRVNNQLRDLIDRLTSREAAERDTPTPRLQVPGSVRSAAAAQRAFDKSTVDEIVRLTRMLLSKGFIGELPAVEVKRLMGYVNNAVGRKDIIKQAKLVVDLLLKHQIDNARKALEKQLSVRGSKVGSKGVEVQGRLDVAGQKALKAFKEYYDKDAETIQRRIEDCMNRMSEEGPAGADAAAEYQGLMMAKRYNEDIKASEAEEFNLKKEIEDENRKMKEGDPEAMSKEEYDEWREAAWEAIRKNRMDRLDAYVGMLRDFGGALRMSVEKAKAFREEEQSRVRKIYHFANSDMQGVPSDEHSKVNFMQRLSNAPVFRFLLSPMISFDSMLRFFGRKSPDGRGYLWNHFMSEWVKRNDEEWKSLKKGHDQLDAKAREIFGDGVRKWSDLFTMERGMQKVPVEFWDGGQKKSHELTQGNMLYIYMVNKMDDGKMKLRRMGISEEDVDRITEILDPRFIQLADWVQDVFLKEKRIKYNEVHERMFGAPMASIDNYFPLVINSRSRGAEVDVALQESDKKPATITGNIIKRVKNSTALDITNVDAFDLVLAHLQQMEHWAAFAELNRDMNTLLSYRHFRNQVMNMVSAQYGSGKKLLDNFKDACAIAGGAYTPKIGQDSLDKHIVNIAKGVTAAKIAFRLFTALKQLLSYPAYFSEASVAELAKSTLNPKGIAESWNWAIEKLPGFAERWQSRKAGDNRLDDTELDYAFWKNRIVETASRWGMSPNAFVDGLTVTMGAKAIYETKKKQYIKDGYDEARAEELALRDASVAYNETQQSSGKAYMSPVQLDRTALSVALTVFRNSSMGYQRRLLNSLRNLSRMANPNWAVESEEFTEKQLRRDGLFDAIKERLINEGMDEEKATAEADMAVHEAAERVYNRSLTRSAVDVVIFGFIMQFAWNLGSYMPYLIGGDDDDKKKEMLEDAAMHALAGGVEGMAGGSVISEIYNKVRKGDNMSGYNINPLPLMSDIQNTLTKVQSDRLYTINNAVNILMQSLVGVNPETITDIVLAFDDAAGGNLDGLHEFAFLMMRLANFPQSQLDELYIDELDLKGKDAVQRNPAELAKRYAEYKAKRNAPLLYWMYSDAEKDKLQQKFIKRFEEKKKERVLIGGDPEVMSVIDGYKESDAYTKTQEALDSIAAMPKDERKEQRDSLYETEEGAMHRAVTKAETKINSFAKKGNTKAVEYLRSEMARMIEGKISVEDFEEELKGFSE